MKYKNTLATGYENYAGPHIQHITCILSNITLTVQKGQVCAYEETKYVKKLMLREAAVHLPKVTQRK